MQAAHCDQSVLARHRAPRSCLHAHHPGTTCGVWWCQPSLLPHLLEVGIEESSERLLQRRLGRPALGGQ